MDYYDCDIGPASKSTVSNIVDYCMQINDYTLSFTLAISAELPPAEKKESESEQYKIVPRFSPSWTGSGRVPPVEYSQREKRARVNVRGVVGARGY